MQLAGDETIDLAGLDFETVQVPGHSPGHLAFYVDEALFSGDVLFAGSVGRTDLPRRAGTPWSSRSVPSSTAFRPTPSFTPATGPETTLGAELARNPFLAELRA